jgi:hypothetical protein
MWIPRLLKTAAGATLGLAMLFCSAEKCALCLLIEGSAECLRKQAQNCAILSKTVFRRNVRATLEQLSLNLMDEARAVENAQKIPAASIDAS